MSKPTTIHKIMDGKVQLWRREGSDCWYCSCSLNEKQRKKSTGEENIERAKDIAESWYIALRAKQLAGMLDKDEGMLFREAARIFLKEYEIITEGQRSPAWVKSHELRVRLHLNPFFGDTPLRKIDSKMAQEYRIHRATERIDEESGKPIPPSRSTMHDEFVTLRMVLKTAQRHKELEYLPDLSPPYKAPMKIDHRPWFSREEYKQLYTTTRENARKPKQAHDRWDAEQMHDYVLFMGNTGLRVDEAKNLQHRDIKVVKDKDTGELILEIEVRGKRGVG